MWRNSADLKQFPVQNKDTVLPCANTASQLLMPTEPLPYCAMQEIPMKPPPPPTARSASTSSAPPPPPPEEKGGSGEPTPSTSAAGDQSSSRARDPSSSAPHLAEKGREDPGNGPCPKRFKVPPKTPSGDLGNGEPVVVLATLPPTSKVPAIKKEKVDPEDNVENEELSLPPRRSRRIPKRILKDEDFKAGEEATEAAGSDDDNDEANKEEQERVAREEKESWEDPDFEDIKGLAMDRPWIGYTASKKGKVGLEEARGCWREHFLREGKEDGRTEGGKRRRVPDGVSWCGGSYGRVWKRVGHRRR